VTTMLAFVFVIGVLVFVHELGHFLAARRIGVRVLKFSLGFGPRLVGFTRGHTEYCISVVPLGGYVKMAGENAEDPRSGQPDEFLSKTKWQRFQVLIMGPAMNVALAVVLLGDRVLTVAGRETRTWEEFDIAIGSRPGRPVTVTVVRQDREQSLSVTPDAEGKFEIGRIGVFPKVHPRVQTVRHGDPAEAAGVKPGDVVIAVNGESVQLARQLSDAIGRHPDRPITLSILRNGQPLGITVTPRRDGDVGRIGISIANELKRIQPGPLGAVWMSVKRNWEYAGLILRTLGGLISGETSPRQLMGPVGIAQLSGESAQEGWVSLFALMASISLNLGLLNLLPVPVLDGGHIFIMALEGVARRDFSIRVKERMLFAGFVLLMLLMVTVIYNDLTRIRWVESLMFWR
jgi:regulator of sigma E protease